MPTAEVICTGVTYFTREQQFDAVGNPRLDEKDNEIWVDVPKVATMGETIELSDYEYDRLLSLNAVQEPGSAPLPGTGRPKPTPFGTPVIDPETGDSLGYEGPIMGRPEPGASVGGLSPEEAAELAAKAAGSSEDKDADAIANREYDKARVPALEAELHERGIDLEDIEPANGEKVLKADLVAALEKDDENQ